MSVRRVRLGGRLGATRAGRRSLRRLLLATGAASTALVLLCALASLLAVAVTARSYEELDRRVQPAQLATAELEAALSESSRGIRGYLLTGEPAFLDAYRRGLTDYPVALSRLRALQRSQTEQELIDRQDTQAQAWFALYQRVPDAPPPTPQQAEPTLVRGKQLLDTFLADNDQLRTGLQQRHSELQQRVGRIRALLTGSLLALGLSAAALAAAVAVRTARAVTGPLAELQHALGQLTAGQHTTRVALCPAAPREVQAVAAGVNALAEEGERLRALEQDRHRMHHLAGSIGRAVREDLDARVAVEQAAAALGQALRAHRVCLRLVRQDGQLPTVRQWTAQGLTPTPTRPLGDQDADQVCQLHRHGQALLTSHNEPDGNGDRSVAPAGHLALGRQLLAQAAALSLVAVPVAAGDAVFGLLTVAQTTPRTWTTPESDLIESVAADLGRALRHAQLFARQRDLVAQLQQLDQARTEFVSTASHELRTPLTSVAGYLEMLREGELGALSADQDHALGVIDRNTTRLRSLVEDLLTLSSVDAGAGAPHRPLGVAELLHAATETVRPAATQAGVHLSVDPGPPGLAVHGDPGQLERVLLNLLSNAIKFSSKGDRVRVDAQLMGPADTDSPARVALTVSDTGIGIPAADQEQLFSRFHRASNATTRGIAGTGLGLTIVRSIIDHHGGSLRLDSVEGTGTTVEIILPAHPDAPHGPADQTSQLAQPA